ncbi:MAG: cupredoxin domain-containing protein [Candidatus Aenigmarchaeota archaeon]|nr:cupredoxin domain-containing protein [Candidatus Aenigmarchaeota archaeon]
MKLLIPLVLVAAVVLISGCTSGTANDNSNTTPGVKEFQVTIGHTAYSPSSFTVTRGDTVRFMAVAAPGTESHNHGITIDEYNINQAVTSSATPTKIEFVADKAGTFQIYCKTCRDGPFGTGHPDIRATLVVQ